MVVAVRVSPPVKGKVPKLNMLELVSVASNRYKISKLKRQHLPQGYCYVCSRIDPSGIFRKTNGHIYTKGFLHTCEHFPKAPYTTFVQEDIPIRDDDGGDSLADFAVDKTETISVTIRRGSKSSGLPSAPKTDDKFNPSLGNFNNKEQESSSESFLKDLKDKFSDYSGGRFRLPSLAHGVEDGLSARSEANRSTARKLNLFRKSSGAQTDFSRKSMFKIASVYAESEPNTARDRVSIKHADSYQNSARSMFTEGAIASTSARTNDLDSMFVPSGRTLAHKQSATSISSSLRLPETQGVFINQSDGLQNVFSSEPLVREIMTIDEHQEPARRLKARFQRERKLHERRASSEHSASTYRPGSGHLRYHHRMDVDSVPDPGFEIPPTPSDDTLNAEQLKLEEENVLQESDKNALHGTTIGSISGDAEHKISGKGAKAAERPELSGVPSEKRSFCRCATDLREISFTRNICKTCGKDCKLRNSSSRGSSQTYSQPGYENFTMRSGRFMPTRLQISEQDEMQMYGLNARSKKVRNKHHMDHDSKINEDDSQYWSSDEEFGDFENSPVSWLRHGKPYPLINPDIHKEAYIKALQAARMKGKQNTEDFEIDEMKMLRRPYVFSYIPLLPYKDKQKIRYIGIRPDDSSKPKNGQFMKHIFGDVRLDDFYPGAKPSKGHGGKLIIDDLAKVSSTEQTSSQDSQIPATSTGPEVSSVSLKLKSMNEL